MKEIIERFFMESSKDLLEYLSAGCKIVFTADTMQYTMEVTESGGVRVEEGKRNGDIEIIGETDVLRDLFSSGSLEGYVDKMCSYIKLGKKPKLKILMERNLENTKRFMRNYYVPLLKLYILR